MAVTAHVNRYAFNRNRKVCAVVQIKPAYEVLVGLTCTGMLSCHHAWNRFNEFANPQHRLQPNVVIAHQALRRRTCQPDLSIGTPINHHFFNMIRGGASFLGVRDHPATLCHAHS